MGSAFGKVCVICGMDCSQKPRTKDAKGRYYCKECHERAATKSRTHAAAPPQAAPSLALEDDDAISARLLEQVIDSMPAKPRSGRECPSCGSDLPHQAVLCTNCGYNARTGQRLRVDAAPASASGGWSMSAPDLGGFLSPPLVGLAIAIVFGVLLFLTVNNPDLVLAFSVALTVFELSVAVLVLVFAFSESVGTGFLTLCVPCYVLYFVFGVCDNAWVRVLFGVSLLLRIISIIVLASTGTWEASGL